MAQNITLLGASYSAVPAVTLPKTGGGTARFDDASVTTAVASDVAQGKIFLAANGTVTTGTATVGSNTFVVTLSWDEDYTQDYGAWIPDCTFSDLQDAYDDGKEIFITTDDPSFAIANGSYFYDEYEGVRYDYCWYNVYWYDNEVVLFQWGSLNADGLDVGEVETISPNLESRTVTYTPSNQTQTDWIEPTYPYNGIANVDVTVNPAPNADWDGGTGGEFVTQNNQRKWKNTAELAVFDGGWISQGTRTLSTTYYNAISSGTTITPTTSAQTIGGANYMMEGAVTVSAMPSGTAGTPTATKGAVSNHSISVTPSVTNTTGYITGGTKTGTAVTVSASELVSGSETKTQNGTYDVTNLAELVVNVSGGSSGMVVGTATKTPTSANASIQFTGLLGEPTSFYVVSSGNLATGASPYKTAAVVFDGTDVMGQYITNTNNAQMTYSSTAFSKSYSNGTLTITGTGTNFQTNEYKLVYTYGGSSANIGTEDVQVGSGATSITFTGLTEEPNCFSVLFKTNIGTASGYTRTHVVVFDGSSVYGMEMGSQSTASSNWTKSYNNGSLTITSQSASAGGYFHQPGYYQLTYGIGGEAPPITTEPLSVTANGTYTAPTGKAYTPVTVNVSGGGSSMNVQVDNQYKQRTANSYGDTGLTLTVAETGTYTVTWTAWRSSSSGTMGTNLHVNNTTGTNQQTFTGTYGQLITLTNQHYNQGDVLTLYATSGSTSRSIYVANLTIIQTAQEV